MLTAGEAGAAGGGGVALRSDGRAYCPLLQQRVHLADPAEALLRSGEVPVTYVAFDLWHLDGIDTTPLTYEERRRLLLDLVEPGPSWQVPAHSVGNGPWSSQQSPPKKSFLSS